MVIDRFDGLSKTRFAMGGFAVCVVSALGYMLIVKPHANAHVSTLKLISICNCAILFIEVNNWSFNHRQSVCFL